MEVRVWGEGPEQALGHSAWPGVGCQHQHPWARCPPHPSSWTAGGRPPPVPGGCQLPEQDPGECEPGRGLVGEDTPHLSLPFYFPSYKTPRNHTARPLKLQMAPDEFVMLHKARSSCWSKTNEWPFWAGKISKIRELGQQYETCGVKRESRVSKQRHRGEHRPGHHFIAG